MAVKHEWQILTPEETDGWSYICRVCSRVGREVKRGWREKIQLTNEHWLECDVCMIRWRRS